MMTTKKKILSPTFMQARAKEAGSLVGQMVKNRDDDAGRGTFQACEWVNPEQEKAGTKRSLRFKSLVSITQPAGLPRVRAEQTVSNTPWRR